MNTVRGSCAVRVLSDRLPLWLSRTPTLLRLLFLCRRAQLRELTEDPVRFCIIDSGELGLQILISSCTPAGIFATNCVNKYSFSCLHVALIKVLAEIIEYLIDSRFAALIDDTVCARVMKVSFICLLRVNLAVAVVPQTNEFLHAVSMHILGKHTQLLISSSLAKDSVTRMLLFGAVEKLSKTVGIGLASDRSIVSRMSL